jgi:hypothetical protein
MGKRLCAAVIGALLLAAGGTSAFAQSQPTTKPEKRLNAARPAKPATTRPAQGAELGRLSDHWTIEQALPNRPRAVERRPAPEAASPLSRVPIQNTPGTIGFDSREIRGTTFSDGRPVPGISQNSYDNSSYVGLSVNVPSLTNAFPIPVPPPPSSGGGW